MKKQIITLAVIALFTGTGVFAYDSYNDAMKAGMETKKTAQETGKILNDLRNNKSSTKAERKEVENKLLEQYAQAAEAFSDAVEKSTDLNQKFQSMSEKARALFDARKAAEALETAKAVTELKDLTDNQLAGAVYIYAWYLSQDRKSSESIAVIQKYINSGKKVNLAGIYTDIYISALLTSKDFNGAKKALEELKSIHPDNPSIKKLEEMVLKASSAQ